MKKKLLSLDDLYRFYALQNKDLTFESSDSNIIVHLDESFSFEKTENEFYSYGNFKLCHTKENRNGTSISEQVMLDAVPTAYNMPILAYIYDNEKTKEKEFRGHELYIDEENGEVIYEESPVGVIPESADLKLEYDKENDKTYLIGTGILWNNYSCATDVIKRMGGTCKVSIEISVDKLSYDAKSKTLVIEKFHFLGVTLLGKTEDGNEILEGMEGSNITLSDFSNSIFKKGGKTVKSNQKNFDEEDPELTGGGNTVVGDDTPADGDASTDGDDTPTDENDEETVESPDETKLKKDGTIDFSVTLGGKVKSFSLTLTEQLRALTELVNDTYGSEDAYYCVDATPDTNEVIMHDCINDKVYRQNYEVVDDVYTLVGERVEVFAKYLTAEEIEQLETLKENYAVLEQKVQDYEKEKNKYSKHVFMNINAKKKPVKYGTIFDK